MSHTSEKRVSLTAKLGSVDLNRSGCNLGDMLCTTFMGKSLWQEMPSGVRSSTEQYLIFHVYQCFPWTSPEKQRFPARSIRCTIVKALKKTAGQSLCAINNCFPGNIETEWAGSASTTYSIWLYNKLNPPIKSSQTERKGIYLNICAYWMLYLQCEILMMKPIGD